MSEQSANLKRVRSKIEHYVLQFCRMYEQELFNADHLRSFIAVHLTAIAPDSACRILRELRQEGKVDYKVVNRRKSLYKVIQVNA